MRIVLCLGHDLYPYANSCPTVKIIERGTGSQRHTFIFKIPRLSGPSVCLTRPRKGAEKDKRDMLDGKGSELGARGPGGKQATDCWDDWRGVGGTAPAGKAASL